MEKHETWDILFDNTKKPTWEEITSYINNPLWDEFNSYIQEVYQQQPELSYSICSAQRGWNVKYKKSGKALCTLYPENGYFIALVVVGSKEEMTVEDHLPTFTDYVQELYAKTRSMPMGRWLMIHVTDEQILCDVKTLVGIRVKPKAQ